MHFNTEIVSEAYPTHTIDANKASLVFIAKTKNDEIRITYHIQKKIFHIESSELNIQLIIQHMTQQELEQFVLNLEYKTFIIAVHNLCKQGYDNNVKELYKYFKQLLSYKIPQTPLADCILLSYKTQAIFNSQNNIG